ncbi:2-hydroxyacid dehydrogenase [Cutibacterium avidum]|uniref:2-hydroxyacid dehydrogenase n=1 Tax=Cutibacterium avidum TaxID=33010 RepID=UPI00083E88BD|nr:2-hydroxyacid dehydrogenase [Cutibacterium avidum]AOG28386.1 hypothetical protein BFS79_07525 [Cutibacterium avidum]
MKILCIADNFIPADYIRSGFSIISELEESSVIRTWNHDSIEDLQHDNLLVEQAGPDAVDVPAAIFDDVADFDAIVTQFCPVPTSVIEAATNLKVIGVLRGGTENVNTDAAAKHHIEVLNTPGRNAEAVAEFTLGMILTETRNIARSQANLRKGSWARDFPNAQSIPEIEGKTVGVIGLGQIGRRVATFVKGMGAQVAYYDPMVEEAGFERHDNVISLATVSDIFCVHARLTPQTRHLVSSEVLSALPPHAILINTARSGLVDEKALVQALRDRTIAGAALDTFDNEPLASDDPLLGLDNVTVTGHLAGSTIDAFRKTPAMLAPRLHTALWKR